MRFSRVCAVAAFTAILATGCSNSDKNTNPSDLSREASAAAQASSPATESSTAPSSANPKPSASAGAEFRVINLTRGNADDIGKELSTTITRVTCLGEPISGIYLESATGSNAKPFGDVELGHQSKDLKIEVMHQVLASEPKYRVNIGCGYVGSTNEWKHEFRIPTIAGARTNSFECAPNAGCALNNKPIDLR